MKKISLVILTSSLLVGSGIFSFAQADDDDRKFRILKNRVNNLKVVVEQNSTDILTNTNSIDVNAANISGNATNIGTNASDIEINAANIGANATTIQSNTANGAANSGNIENNASNIADNFSQIQGNRADISRLDRRVRDIESSPPSSGGSDGTRKFVEVDCTLNSNALFEAPINNYFPDNTTYNISGACNGPIYVTEDAVRFVGVTPDASLVLPIDADPSSGTVFGDGAHDLRIQNLLIDASAWGSAAAEGSDAAGVYARNAYVRVINSNIVGGLYGINPYRNAIVRLDGTVNVTDFVNAGISIGDQSVITTRGQVNVRSTRSDGSYLNAVELYRNGNADFRGGLTIDVPPIDYSTGSFPRAVFAGSNSHLRVRNGGLIELKGDVFITALSTLSLEGGTLAGNLGLSRGASAQLFSVTQTGDSNNIGDNSSFEAFDSILTNSNIQSGASFRMNGGEINGAIVQLSGMAFMEGVFVTNIISAERPSLLDLNSSNMNGNLLSFCDENTTFFSSSIVTNAVDTCP